MKDKKMYNTTLFYKNKKNKRFLKWAVIFAIFFLCLTFLFKFVLTSSFFKVKEVKIIECPSYLNEKAVLSSIKNKIFEKRWKSFLGEDNILFWVGENNYKNITFPFIKEIEKKINWRNKSVQFKLSLRNPEGVICNNEDCYFFDEEGIIFLKAPYVEGSLILKINDKTGRKIFLGQKVFPESKWLNNFREIIYQIKKSGTMILETGIEDFSKEEWYLKIGEGTIFYFSFNFVPQNLNHILSYLFKHLDLEKTAYIDFRVEDRVYYK